MSPVSGRRWVAQPRDDGSVERIFAPLEPIASINPRSGRFFDRNDYGFRRSIGTAVRSSLAPRLAKLLLEAGRRALNVDVRRGAGGNRQLNCALYRIAITQARYHPAARAYLERKQAEGKSRREAIRCLKRLLIRVVFNTLKGSPALT